MRDNYVNDIGDYAKYALMRSVAASCPEDASIGVIWYATNHIEANSDGRIRVHLREAGWDALDPDLLGAMRNLESVAEGHVTMEAVQRSVLLPARTRFAGEPLPLAVGNGRLARSEQRAAWFGRALEKVRDCHVVLLDPDNGLEPPRAVAGALSSVKYARVAEVTSLLQAGLSVVLYQHGDRTPWIDQRRRVVDRVMAAGPEGVRCRTLRFRAHGSRSFFCFSTTAAQASVLDDGLSRLERRVFAWSRKKLVAIE